MTVPAPVQTPSGPYEGRFLLQSRGAIHEIERDVVKRWMKEGFHLACIGPENQTAPDPDMPLRVIGYDGASYRAQPSGQGRYPVITMVLCFGFERLWERNLTLKNRLRIREKNFQFFCNFLLTSLRGFAIIKNTLRRKARCADVAHLVERHLAKVEVASSSLVIRSINHSGSGVVFCFSEENGESVPFYPNAVHEK